MSDSDMSDSDEEMGIDFRAPGISLTSPRILDGDIIASPEPSVIHIEPDSALASQTYLRRNTNTDPAHAGEETELGQLRARWANVIRGVEAAAASLSSDSGSQTINHNPSARSRRRRGALGLNPERELGFMSTSIWPSAETTSGSNSGVPTVLFDQSTSLTSPPPELRDLPSADSEPNDSSQNTPRPTGWDGSFASSNEYFSPSILSASFPDISQWTWTNESPGLELREGETGPARTFDPDGEFLEGLEGEWDEDMARLFELSTTEEKNEGGDSMTTTMFWL